MKKLFVAVFAAVTAIIPAYSQTYQALNSSSIYLVDYDASRSVMLFRGNIPFTSTSPQAVDFSGLEAAFTNQFNAQTGKTFPSSYSFVDISLINADEGLNLEAASFNPANMPPTSNPVIEMPPRLPRSTARPEGGIRMSTPPIARVGPIAVFGS